MSAPLTPSDCDLRDFPRMMLDIPRLRGSDFDAMLDDGAWRAGLNLWMTSWHQVPAGSLSADDASLAKAAGLGRDLRSWKKVKEQALRGWIKCDDGNLYHEVVSEMALEAWIDKLGQRLSSGAGNAKRYGTEFDPAPLYDDIRAAAAMLENLNSRSRSLSKRHVQKARGVLPVGEDNLPVGDPPGLPVGSQGKGREGKGTNISSEPKGSSDARSEIELEVENDNEPAEEPPVRGKVSKRKPETAIPDGYPDAKAIAEAQAKIRAEGANLDARLQAEKFRNYAGQNDRRCRDWSMAWRNWIVGAIERAPKVATATSLQGPKVAPEFDGPPELRLSVARFAGEPFAVKYIDQCRWDATKRRLIAKTGFAADEIRRELRKWLEKNDVTIAAANKPEAA